MGCVGSKAIAVEQAPAQRAPEAEVDVVAPAEEVAAAEQAAPAVPTTTAANEKKDDHHDEAPVDEASAANPASAGNEVSPPGFGPNDFPRDLASVTKEWLSFVLKTKVSSFESKVLDMVCDTFQLPCPVC